MGTKPEIRKRPADEVIAPESEKRTRSLQKSAKANDRTCVGIDLNDGGGGTKCNKPKTSRGSRPLTETENNDLIFYIQKYSGSSDVPLGESVDKVNSKYICALEYRTQVKINPYDLHFGGMVKWKAQRFNPVLPSQSKLSHEFGLFVSGYARLQFGKLRKCEGEYR